MRQDVFTTQREFDFPADATLMSTTDTQSHVTYANAAFIAVSGFDRDEIMGKPHNLVRHPDMPKQAFADMWATLKLGKSWTALVKNRRRNGDYYWVRANATPVIRRGQVTGYMSVRTKPSRFEIEAAESLYRKFRRGEAGSLAFHQGLIIRTGWLGWMSVFQKMPVRWRIRSGFCACAALGCAAAAGCGLSGDALGTYAAGTATAALALSLWLESQIARPLDLVQRQALSVAAGQPIENKHLNRVDEIGMILRAVNQAGLNLRSLVDDVSEQVGGVLTTSSEIADGNHDLNSRTEDAASNLEETAAAMEEMNSTVKNNAAIACKAAELAEGANQAASSGGAIVREVVEVMQEISAASQQISSILGVIDGIAFQTNILALNAAVEAARAGELGKGFGVVASEVRNLAQRCASSAKEIKSLVGASLDKVGSGALKVDAAGRAMADILTQAARVNDLIGQINHSTVEQSRGIDEVNVAISQLDHMTQQNAALVEESAVTAGSLAAQAQRLAESVSVFKG